MARIFLYLHDVFALYRRRDISFREKVALVCALSLTKLQQARSGTMRFLTLRIAYKARANLIHILREVFVRGEYALPRNTGAPRIIDAGANIGVATLFFKRYHPDAHIIAIEASPTNFALLQKNISQNGLRDVTPIFGAIGNEEGTRVFYCNERNPGGSTAFSQVAESKQHEFAGVEVPALRLSAYLTEEVDVLKMDIEGGECEVLEELSRTGTLRMIQHMVFEYHANENNPANALETILHIFKKENYSFVIYDNEQGAFGAMHPLPRAYHCMIRASRNNP